MLLLLRTETCGSGEDGCGISLIISISVSTIVSRREKAVYPWCKLLSHWGVQFNEVLGTLVWNGGLLRNRVQGFLKYTLRNRGGARVRSSGCLCQWREDDSLRTESTRTQHCAQLCTEHQVGQENCRANSYNKSQRDALFLKFIFDKELYMFRTDLVSVIRSLNNVYAAISICHASYVNCCR